MLRFFLQSIFLETCVTGRIYRGNLINSTINTVKAWDGGEKFGGSRKQMTPSHSADSVRFFKAGG